MLIQFFFFNDTATTEIYTLSLHDALPIYRRGHGVGGVHAGTAAGAWDGGALDLEQPRVRSEEHTSELQSLAYLVCRLLLEKKKSSVDDVPIRSRNIHQTTIQPVTNVLTYT